MVKKLEELTDDFQEYLLKDLEDPENALEYLKLSLADFEEDGHLPLFLHSLRNLVVAQGGIAKFSEKTKLNRQHLYRLLAENGNPRLATLFAVLKGLGYALSVTPLDKKDK